jgi:hypothetical protein
VPWCGLAPSYGAVADDVAFDEPIRQSMAEAFAAAGGVVRTPAMVLDQDPPVGFLGPVVAAPPTGADALPRWDAVVALAAVAGVLEVSCPRPPRPKIPGLRLPSRNGVGRTCSGSAPNAEQVTGSSPPGEHNWLTSKVLLTAVQAEAIGSVTQRTGSMSPDGLHLRWSARVWWARQGLNL